MKNTATNNGTGLADALLLGLSAMLVQTPSRARLLLLQPTSGEVLLTDLGDLGHFTTLEDLETLNGAYPDFAAIAGNRLNRWLSAPHPAERLVALQDGTPVTLVLTGEIATPEHAASLLSHRAFQYICAGSIVLINDGDARLVDLRELRTMPTWTGIR